MWRDSRSLSTGPQCRSPSSENPPETAIVEGVLALVSRRTLDRRRHVSEYTARGEGPGMGLNDSIFNRLLRERIIWLGDEVRDDNANVICAQMMLLAAEDP